MQKARPNLKPVADVYQKELKTLADELANEKLAKEITDFMLVNDTFLHNCCEWYEMYLSCKYLLLIVFMFLQQGHCWPCECYLRKDPN